MWTCGGAICLVRAGEALLKATDGQMVCVYQLFYVEPE